MPNETQRTAKSLLLQALDERRSKRTSLMDRMPVVREIKETTLQQAFLGLTRLGTRALNRFPIRGLFGATYGLVGPYFFRALTNIRATDSFIDNVADYLAVSTLWGLFDVDIVSASDSCIEVQYGQCPLSIQDERKLCRAYMAMEPQLSKKTFFQTRITVLECIPDGQGRCRILFEKR